MLFLPLASETARSGGCSNPAACDGISTAGVPDEDAQSAESATWFLTEYSIPFPRLKRPRIILATELGDICTPRHGTATRSRLMKSFLFREGGYCVSYDFSLTDWRLLMWKDLQSESAGMPGS